MGIVSDSKGKCNVLANEKIPYVTKEGGIHPRAAADQHFRNADIVVKNALEKANLKMKDIDCVSFSQGPGLGNCLKVGAVTARTLSLGFSKPLIGVNHCVAHIEIGKALTKAKDPIVIYSSGANTQIIGYENKKYRVFGETLDIGVGNLLDSFGRKIGLGFPAGPIIDKWYSEEFDEENFVELPYSAKGMDLVFSGLQTAAENLWNKEKQKFAENEIEKLEQLKKNIACSLMHTAFAMLTEVSERALAHTEKNEILMTGGVAASQTLRKMIQSMARERNAKLFVPPIPVCVDNGAMIAWLGLVEFKSGHRTKISESQIMPMQRTDMVEIDWIK